jgi:hypothetical protein
MAEHGPCQASAETQPSSITRDKTARREQDCRIWLFVVKGAPFGGAGRAAYSLRATYLRPAVLARAARPTIRARIDRVPSGEPACACQVTSRGRPCTP